MSTTSAPDPQAHVPRAPLEPIAPKRPLRRSSLTPEQRRTQARLAALSRWANTTDRTAATQAARDGLAAKWAAAPNPEAAKRAHMTRMALTSSRKRKTA